MAKKPFADTSAMVRKTRPGFDIGAFGILQKENEGLRETVANLESKLATANREIQSEHGGMMAWQSDAKEATGRVKDLKRELFNVRRLYDRLLGYVDRIRESEAPEERRQQTVDRRRPIDFDRIKAETEPYFPDQFDRYSNKREQPKEWYE